MKAGSRRRRDYDRAASFDAASRNPKWDGMSLHDWFGRMADGVDSDDEQGTSSTYQAQPTYNQPDMNTAWDNEDHDQYTQNYREPRRSLKRDLNRGAQLRVYQESDAFDHKIQQNKRDIQENFAQQDKIFQQLNIPNQEIEKLHDVQNKISASLPNDRDVMRRQTQDRLVDLSKRIRRLTETGKTEKQSWPEQHEYTASLSQGDELFNESSPTIEIETLAEAVLRLARKIEVNEGQVQDMSHKLQEKIENLQAVIKDGQMALDPSEDTKPKEVARMIDALEKEVEHADVAAREMIEGLKQRARTLKERRAGQDDPRIVAIEQIIHELDGRLEETVHRAFSNRVPNDDSLKERLETLTERIAGKSDNGIAALQQTIIALENKIGKLAAKTSHGPEMGGAEKRLESIEKNLLELSQKLSENLNDKIAPQIVTQSVENLNSPLMEAIGEITYRQQALDNRAIRSNHAWKPQHTAVTTPVKTSQYSNVNKGHAETQEAKTSSSEIEDLKQSIIALRQILSTDNGTYTTATIGEDIRSLTRKVEEFAHSRLDNSGLEDLHREVLELRKSIDSQRPDGIVQSLESSYHHILQRLDELKQQGVSANAIDSLYTEINSLREQIDTIDVSSRIDILNERLLTISGDVEALRHEAGTPHDNTVALQHELSSLRVAIENREPVDTFQAMERHIADIADKMDALEHVGTSSQLLEQKLADIDYKIGDIKSSHDPILDQRLADVQGRLDSVNNALLTSDVFNEKMTDITYRLDSLVHENAAKTQQQTGLAADRIEQRMADISHKVEDLHSITDTRLDQQLADVQKHFRGLDNTLVSSDVFDQRMIDILHRLDTIVDDNTKRDEHHGAALLAAPANGINQGNLTQIEDRIEYMVGKLESLSVKAEADPQLEAHIAGLAQKIDHILDTVPNASHHQKSTEIDHLQSQIQRLSDLLEGQSDSGILSKLENRVQSLVKSLNSVEQTASSDLNGIRSEITSLKRDMIETSRAGFKPLEEQIHSLVQKIDNASSGAIAENTAIDQLEVQIASTLERLEALSPLANLGAVTQSLDRIQEQLDSASDNAVVAAQQAAQEAVQQLGSHEDLSSGVLTQLANQLQRIDENTKSSDLRTQKTLEAFHDTLKTIVGRINSVERDIDKTEQQKFDDKHVNADPVPNNQHKSSKQAQFIGEHVNMADDTPLEPGSGRPPRRSPPKSAAVNSPQSGNSTKPANKPEEKIAPQSSKMQKKRVSAQNAAQSQDAQMPPGAKQPRPEAQQAQAPMPRGADEARANFIAAARRAAQVAAEETSAIDDNTSTKPNLRERISVLGRRRSQPKHNGETNTRSGASVSGASVRKDMAQDHSKTNVVQRQRARMQQTAISNNAPQVQPDDAFGQQMTPSKNSPLDKINSIVKKHRRPVIFGLAGCIVIFGALKLIGGLFTAEPNIKIANQPATTQKENNITTVKKVNLNTTATHSIEPSSAIIFDQPQPQSPQLTNTVIDGDVASTTIINDSLPNLSGQSRFTPNPDFTPPNAITSLTLQEAIRAGNPSAYFETGRRYMEGFGVPQDLKEAARWYQIAAENALAPAQFRLANLYEKGHGVKMDLQTAHQWYERAAQAGNIKAMHNLAVLYAEGIDGTPNLNQASYWFRQAASHGLKDSQFNLGVLYIKGLGVERDLIESYKWFALAATQGDTDAGQKRDELARSMDQAVLQQAQTIVDEWKAISAKPSANKVDAPAGGWGEPTLQQTSAAETPKLIQAAQKLLNDLGYHAGPADGVAGPKTREAIKAFQAKTGLPINGKVNPILVDVLMGHTT